MYEKTPMTTLGINECGMAAREKAETIADNQAKRHQREFEAWNWIRVAMLRYPPSVSEEEALHQLLSRVRREGY